MSAADEIAEFYVHSVTVERLAGAQPWGDVYDPPVTVRCFVDEDRRFVRDGAGREVVSEATLTAPPEAAQHFTPGSVVTVNGRRAQVIKAARAESHDLGLPDHTEITLT